MLFNKELVEKILSGKKVETRRAWKRCMVREDRVYAAKTDYRNDSIFAYLYIKYVRRERLMDMMVLYGKDSHRCIKFAYLYIKYVRRERLMDMGDDGAIREGFSSLQEFKDVWVKCYGSWNPDEEVYVIGFEMVKNGVK
jgi:hypothetical protein